MVVRHAWDWKDRTWVLVGVIPTHANPSSDAHAHGLAGADMSF